MAVSTRPPRTRPRALLGGGTDGNERLTGLTGLLLVVLLAVLGVTIIRIGQLLWLHLFLGLVLIGPLALKLLSTGYRFVRYYSHNATYRDKGPPHPILRGLAPAVVFLTLAVFVTGILLLGLGPSSRDPWVLIHKVTFILWIVVTALHVLGHVPEILKLRPGSQRASLSGEAGRWVSLSSAVALGLVVAVLLIHDFSAWTNAGLHHH
jgi:hypothetical protein